MSPAHDPASCPLTPAHALVCTLLCDCASHHRILRCCLLVLPLQAGMIQKFKSFLGQIQDKYKKKVHSSQPLVHCFCWAPPSPPPSRAATCESSSTPHAVTRIEGTGLALLTTARL